MFTNLNEKNKQTKLYLVIMFLMYLQIILLKHKEIDIILYKMHFTNLLKEKKRKICLAW